MVNQNDYWMGSIDERSSPSSSFTNSRTDHTLSARIGEQMIVANLLHNSFQLPAQPSSVASVNSIDSVDAYPLFEGQEPPDDSEVPPEVKIPHTKRLTPVSYTHLTLPTKA